MMINQVWFLFSRSLKFCGGRKETQNVVRQAYINGMGEGLLGDFIEDTGWMNWALITNGFGACRDGGRGQRRQGCT